MIFAAATKLATAAIHLPTLRRAFTPSDLSGAFDSGAFVVSLQVVVSEVMVEVPAGPVFPVGVVIGPDLGIANERGEQPLYTASSLGRLEVMEALLDAGADAAARDGRGETFLEILEGWYYDEVAAKLAERVPAGLLASLA
ncbi:Ankyrin repeat-containing domain protein [Ophiocordyceps sinensis CO18]|uniref:Ankyrin repeat-containing domain protein n=1 Tax=Ophiocordyceps sinensis (strain Co18 / CGMCC 3.14243) TaxID=911162 RepID=T5A9S3_OPHSC|nr:Ankyrin repeat-containing domain protein [Ophiocordyceps sinensis CO18]